MKTQSSNYEHFTNALLNMNKIKHTNTILLDIHIQNQPTNSNDQRNARTKYNVIEQQTESLRQVFFGHDSITKLELSQRETRDY